MCVHSPRRPAHNSARPLLLNFGILRMVVARLLVDLDRTSSFNYYQDIALSCLPDGTYTLNRGLQDHRFH